MILRPYQTETVDAIMSYLDSDDGNPLAELATGVGKSLCIAELTKRLVEGCGARVLMLAHKRELIAQNTTELLNLWGGAPVGINCAALGRRDRRAQILFASIQSVAREDAYSLGERHVIIVDECHLMPRNGDGQYRTLTARLRERFNDLRIIGFTATPFRLDSGRLDTGADALFSKTVYTYGIAQGVDDGYLAPLVSRGTGQIIDVSHVPRRGGEFASGAPLEYAADKITEAACDEIVERGSDRRSWLVFCSGVSHAENVRDALRARGISCEAVTDRTSKADRERIFRDFKAGRLRSMTGYDVFSTGTNFPAVDLIADLNPTLSTSRFVQKLGRGTRPIYASGYDLNSVESRLDAIASGPKPNCLVLDYAGNVRRHGPVDAVSVKGGPSGTGEGKVTVDSVQAKACPTCEALVSTRVYTCPYCGHEWERPPAVAPHAAKADREAAVMSREIVDRWLNVRDAHARTHVKGDRVSLRIDYEVGASVYSEWVTIEHDGFAGAKAAKWWRTIIGTDVPATAIRATGEFVKEARILAIMVAREDKYWRVIAWRVLRKDGRVVEIDAKFNVRQANLQIARAS